MSAATSSGCSERHLGLRNNTCFRFLSSWEELEAVETDEEDIVLETGINQILTTKQTSRKEKNVWMMQILRCGFVIQQAGIPVHLCAFLGQIQGFQKMSPSD